MVSLWSWLFSHSQGQQRQQPERVPTDTVLALPCLENSWMFRCMVTNWTFRFHDVLDPDMLHGALEELITAGPNWRKLGGRFRVNDRGDLEMHIPVEFTPQRPAVQYTHEVHDISIHKHVLDGTLPVSWERPGMIDSPEQLDAILAGPDAPTCIDDWLYTDRPALALHIINFKDATFVTLTYSHSLVDGAGKREIIANWCRVLAGRMQDVTPLVDLDEEDPVAAVAKVARQNKILHVHERDMLKGWRKWWFVFRLLGHMLGYRNRRQRNVFIPASTMARIRQAAESGGHEYLSDNQLLTTWLVRLACLPWKNSSRPIAIFSAVNLRGFPQLGELRPGVAYLQNLIAYAWTNTTAPLLLRQPLGTAAALIRGSLKQQLTVDQVRAATRLTYDAFARTGSNDIFANMDSHLVSVSSLATAKYLDVADFAPAVSVGQQVHPSPQLSGKPVWQSSTPRSGMKPACQIIIQGKDQQGNWWAQMVLPTRIWGMIESELQKW